MFDAACFDLSDNSFDTVIDFNINVLNFNLHCLYFRMYHLGCPVLYGDKWILNKWIRWKSQMFTFKCFKQKENNYPSNSEVVKMVS